MKLNIKGLVFVGFAAAVFASAAHADNGDKTVTSKQYVDAKYVGDGAVSVADGEAGTANANKKVITVASMSAASADAAGTRGTVQAPAGAQNKFLRGDNSWQEIDGQAYSSGDTNTITVDNHQITAVTTGGVAANGTNLVTGGQVDTAITLTGVKLYGENSNLTATNKVVTIPDMVGVTHDNANDIDVAGKHGLVPAPAVANKTQFLRGDGTWADPANTEYSFATGTDDGTFGYSTDGSTYTDVTVKNVEVTTNKADAITTGDNGNYTSTTEYASVKAVYDFLMNGATTANCSDAAPCALVLGSGVPTWEPIQQAPAAQSGD